LSEHDHSLGYSCFSRHLKKRPGPTSAPGPDSGPRVAAFARGASRLLPPWGYVEHRERLALVLEPCARNGQLQYRAWDRGAMARHYARALTLAERIDLQMGARAA
jgi:hypothetical protein